MSRWCQKVSTYRTLRSGSRGIVHIRWNVMSVLDACIIVLEITNGIVRTIELVRSCKVEKERIYCVMYVYSLSRK